ncbi:MAG: transporter [Geobacteraceae bacterium GWC2_53_11]|nr:MAG: transporter [Geobacteraceae bacterium GWC2_53_11]
MCNGSFPYFCRIFLALIAAGIIGGCASVNFDKSLSTTNQMAAGFTQGKLSLAQTEEQRTEMNRLAEEILQKPVSQGDAVLLALANSPGLQAMLAQNWSDAARAAQTGRISNPVFTFERLLSAGELELSGMIAFGLLDLLTLPQRSGMAQHMIDQAQLQLTSDVVDHITQVRLAWVKAVAARQNLFYAKQVHDAAQASAELGRLLQSAGNFNKIQRARQQAFYADATAQWATAQHEATSAREELIRLFGLTDGQSSRLLLPDRLPDLPKEPLSPEQAGSTTSKTRLDIRLARAEYEAAAKAQGLTMLTSFTDIELGVRYDSVKDRTDGHKTIKRGYEVSVSLPIFDWGDNQRDAMNARTLAAAYRLEATTRAAGSNLRQNYSAYRTTYDIARHYRDEVVPLRKTISEENLLRYNGMLIGVFELLADTRDQINSVIAAIDAERQFWLADAALQASMIGKPMQTSIAFTAGSGKESRDAPH